MRITIEIDEKSGAVSSPSPAAPAAEPGAPLQQAAPQPPADVLALAAASGAINAGPAPANASATTAAPDPFHSSVAAAVEAHAGAVSAGSAVEAKPCG